MTPLMQQYWDIKTLHTDKILLFRMGDFFEMFFDDAVTAAPILGIALTQRNKKSQDETPMCGMPHHSMAGPINKLLSMGLKVAICDQIEDPKLAKGLVKRAVTRVLTPGMVYDPETLEGSESHYMMSFDTDSVSYIEPTTGECFYLERNSKKISDFLNFPLAEIVIESWSSLSDVDRQEIELWKIQNRKVVSEQAGIESVQSSENLPLSARRLLSYIRGLCFDFPIALRPFEKRSWQSRLILANSVFRHLEIFENSLGENTGTFFSAINRTKTSGGARLLKEYLRFPLTEVEDILTRQREVALWRQDLGRLEQQRRQLSFLGDLERRLMKISQPTVNPKDLLILAEGLELAHQILQVSSFENSNNNYLDLLELSREIQKTIQPEPPVNMKNGGYIQSGVSAVLDELMGLSSNSQGLLQKLEEKEKERTQINSLKIRYNNVFGYYIEVTNTHKDKVPADYQRKQTLANAERFCTEELLELERKVLSAQTRRTEVELALFDQLKKKILSLSQSILMCAQDCNRRDVMTALAWLSVEQNYTQPNFGGSEIQLELSRHPVVEQTLKTPFVANSVTLSNRSSILLTGPNMAGKSTLMRQVALAVILAQIGSFVPAKKAQLPIFKQIFTRIGASDHLSQGLSTFMVEMKETADVLRGAGPESLVILDEIGRGTSTYDGMSLAQAILEHLLTYSKSYILFATHYHELTSMDQTFPELKNAHMSIQEVVTPKGLEIRFLHTLAAGPAQKSYGIHVAELAGLPAKVLKRARELLRKNEINQGKMLKHNNSSQLSLLDLNPEEEFSGTQDSGLATLEPAEIDPKELQKQEFIKKFSNLSVDETTPIQALNLLAKLKTEVQELR